MKQENELKLILIYEEYIEYMIQLLIKLPRTEKFSIETDFKQEMYRKIFEYKNASNCRFCKDLQVKPK